MSRGPRSIESCPSPEQWPLISEATFEQMINRPSVSEPALSSRNRHMTSRSLDDDLQVKERALASKVMDEKMSAESPAPPPPSPEPKDREHAEFRSRKDLKSRDSLSMAPLFEVSEVEEGDINRAIGEEGESGLESYRSRNDGDVRRMRQVRQIHAVIPQAKVEQESSKKEVSEENDNNDDDDVMVSQITVTHVTPKGPNAKQGEKVQETFLNVDIPAEEISSVKAEHGSTHHEDVSSNATVVQSNSTSAGSEVSVSIAGVEKSEEIKEEKEDKVDQEDESECPKEVHERLEDALINDGAITDRDQSIILGRENSMNWALSDDSAISPELVCDSARFLNHELVSPDDGELEDESETRMLPLLNECIVDEEALESLQQTQKEGDKENGDNNDNNVDNEKTGMNGQDADIEPPGSFFFNAASFSGTPQENDISGEGKVDRASDIADAGDVDGKIAQGKTESGDTKDIQDDNIDTPQSALSVTKRQVNGMEAGEKEKVEVMIKIEMDEGKEMDETVKEELDKKEVTKDPSLEESKVDAKFEEEKSEVGREENQNLALEGGNGIENDGSEISTENVIADSDTGIDVCENGENNPIMEIELEADIKASNIEDDVTVHLATKDGNLDSSAENIVADSNTETDPDKMEEKKEKVENDALDSRLEPDGSDM